MAFTQSFKPFYYIVDKDHKYVIAYIDTNDNCSKIKEIKLKSIENIYAMDVPGYKKNWTSSSQDIEDIYELLELLKTIEGKIFKYKVDDTNATFTIDSFELVAVEPSITCTQIVPDALKQVYQEKIADKLAKKRCRFNNLIKKLDIGKLSHNDLKSLEEAVKHIK